MSVRRAHEAQVEHLAELDVVGELAESAQEAVFFLARKRGAYPALAVLFVFSQGLTPRKLKRINSRHEGSLNPRYVHAKCCLQAVDQLSGLVSFRAARASPPATEVRRPKICASPCQATRVPAAVPGVDRTLRPCSRFRRPTLPCPLYCARLGRLASASSIFTSAIPLMYEMPTFTFTLKCCGIVHGHALKVREQRREFIGIGEEVVDLLRRFRSHRTGRTA